MANQSISDPLIVSAIGYAIMGSIYFVFGLYFLTRKAPLLVRGRYVLILGIPIIVFFIGITPLYMTVTPVASLTYYLALTCVTPILTFLLIRTSSHLTLFGIKKRLIGDMFPVAKGDSVAHITVNKWLNADEYIIRGSQTQWTITTTGRSGLMTIASDKPTQKAEMDSLIQDLKNKNSQHFTGKVAFLFLAIGTVGAMISLGLLLLTQFLFS